MLHISKSIFIYVSVRQQQAMLIARLVNPEAPARNGYRRNCFRIEET